MKQPQKVKVIAELVKPKSHNIFQILPDELIPIIAKALNDKDLNNYSETSRRFWKLTKDIRYKRKEIYIIYIKEVGLGQKPDKHDLRTAGELSKENRLAEIRWIFKHPQLAKDKADEDTSFYRRSLEYEKHPFKDDFDRIQRLVNL